METKSKIRNRWYRATEKPLVANQSTVESAHNPVGEINISEINFTDDLNDESARAVSQKAKSSNSLPNEEDRRNRSSSNKEKNLLIEKLKIFVMQINQGGKRRKVIKLIVMRKANLIKMILEQEIKKDFKMKIVPKKKNHLQFQNFCLNCLVPDQSIKTV